MSKVRYGVTKLMLLNAGLHQASIFPMQDSLSIAGRNNIGKTQALQAMQFVFFAHLKSMNFSGFDLKVSRNFFFPAENSFIVMELSLPTGTYLLGAYGKGPAYGNEYEHFAAKHKLDLNDFIEGNRICSHNRVFERWNESGTHFIGLNREELRQMIYGEYSKVKGGRWDMTLVPLINAGEKRYGIFSQIYRNLLTQSDVKSHQLKQMFVTIFGDKLNNTAVDFNQVVDESFREYQSNKDQIERTEFLAGDIKQFKDETDRFDDCIKEASFHKRRLAVNLARARRDLPGAISLAKESLEAAIKERKELDVRNKSLREQLNSLTARIGTYRNYEKEMQEIAARNLMSNRADVEASLEGTSTHIVNIRNRLEQVGDLNVESLLRRIERIESQVNAKRREIDQYVSGKRVLDVLELSDDQLGAVARVASRGIFTLPADCLVEHKPGSFVTYLNAHMREEQGVLKGDGFSLNVETIDVPSFVRVDEQTLRDDLTDLEKLALAERGRLDDAENADRLRAELQTLAGRKHVYQKALADFDRHDVIEQIVLNGIEDHKMDLEAQAEINLELDQHNGMIDELSAKHEAARNELKALESANQELIFIQRNPILSNDSIPMAEGEDELFEVPLGEFEFEETIRRIASNLHALDSIRNSLKASRQRIIEGLPDLSAFGDDKMLAEKAVERVTELPRQRERLAQLHTKAVCDVAVVLENLRQDYEIIENQINQFNRSINQRKISNLKRFDIVLKKNDVVVESIETLVEYMKFHRGDGGLFGPTEQVISDPEVKRAFDRLTKAIDEGSQGGIQLLDLFELAYRTVDGNGKETIVDKIDSLASTGTKMVMKPLLYMYMIRYLTDKKVVEPDLPFFIDEVAGVDTSNQRTILGYCRALGFVPVFSSVDPTITARYGVNVGECLTSNGKIYITEDDWQHFEEMEEELAEDQADMIQA